MEWFKVSSLLPTDPKWKRLSPRAKVAYIEWTCEIAQHETDGIYYATGKAPAYVDELIGAGLVVTVAEGYELPAYLKWNPSKAELERQRERGRARQARHRNAVTPPVSHTSPGSTEVEVEREVDNTLEAFDRFWSVYPRKVGKPKALAAFKAACRRAPDGGVRLIVGGAQDYANDPNREDAYTAHPTTWLNRDGWLDPPLPPRNGGGPAPKGSNTHLRALADELERQGK